MGAHKLDIEFEDEDDLQAKDDAADKAAKSQAQVDAVDLEFGAAVETSEPERSVESSVAPKKPTSEQALEARPQEQQKQEQQKQKQQAPQGGAFGGYLQASPGAANYNLGDELRDVISGNRILEIELQAKVEIAVAHRLTNIITEAALTNKVLEIKVNKLLGQIAVKAPALKKELAMIKRLLAENAIVDKSQIESKEKAPTTGQPIKKKKIA